MPYKDKETERAYHRAWIRAYRKKHPERHRRVSASWRARNPEKTAAMLSAWQLANPEKRLLGAAKANAKSKGLLFDLTLDDITIPERCPVLGIPLEVSGKRTPGTPSLDRIDNAKGYVKGNVMVVSWRANSLKSNASLDEIEKIAAYMRRHLK